MLYPVLLAEQQHPLGNFWLAPRNIAIFSSAPEPPKKQAGLVFLSDRKVEEISLPKPIPAKWFSRAERQIRNSVRLQGEKDAGEFETVTSGVAISAIQFFQEVSDILPTEPYLYTSTEGDLVAEFRGRQGSLTAIVGERKLWLFSIQDGGVTKEHWTMSRLNQGAIRASLKKLAGTLNANGAVGA